MKLVNQYIIPFSGLKEGDHRFDFKFDQKFFDEHEVIEARKGTLVSSVLLHKKTNLLSFEINIEGSLEIQCDKCLEFFNFPIHYQGGLVVKFGEDPGAGTDEIWIINPREHELDLEQHFFECIGLCLPIQRFHPEDENGNPTCDPDMLRIIESYSSNEDKIENTDPRWNKLKNFLNDTNIN